MTLVRDKIIKQDIVIEEAVKIIFIVAVMSTAYDYDVSFICYFVHKSVITHNN